MGLFYQGYGCRCDHCCDQVEESIGGNTKGQISRIAKTRGWMSVRATYWFCCAGCLGSWWSQKNEDPAYRDLEKDVMRELDK